VSELIDCMDLGNLEIVIYWMKPGSNGRDGVSRPVERAWEVRRQRFSRLRECGEG